MEKEKGRVYLKGIRARNETVANGYQRDQEPNLIEERNETFLHHA